MATKLEICNMALSHLGVGEGIAAISESSEPARACRLFYDQARDEVLTEIPWTFASKRADLALITADPNDDWGYSYQYPSDALAVRRIPSILRNETRASRVSYYVSNDTDNRVLFTDTAEAALEYTYRVEQENLFPPLFVQALAFKLAFYLAPRLTKGDPFGLRKSAYEGYQMTIGQAKAQNFNEQQEEMVPDSEFINAREE